MSLLLLLLFTSGDVSLASTGVEEVVQVEVVLIRGPLARLGRHDQAVGSGEVVPFAGGGCGGCGSLAGGQFLGHQEVVVWLAHDAAAGSRGEEDVVGVGPGEPHDVAPAAAFQGNAVIVEVVAEVEVEALFAPRGEEVGGVLVLRRITRLLLYLNIIRTRLL